MGCTMEKIIKIEDTTEFEVTAYSDTCCINQKLSMLSYIAVCRIFYTNSPY